jgi:hypothetical protein
MFWNPLRPWVELRAHPSSRRRRSRRYAVLAVTALEDRTLPSFAAPVALDLGAAPKAVAVGRLEGANAPPDVVTANADGTLSVLLGDGHGGLRNPIRITLASQPNAVAVGDFRGNGLQDIVTANQDWTISVLLSNGNGAFQPAKTFSAGGIPVGVAVGDFLGDGRLDLVTANRDGSVSVLPGNGDGTFGAPLVTTVGGVLTSVAVGDFNRDGKPDIVVGTSTGLSVLLGNGNGTFRLESTIPFPIDPAMPDITEPVTSVAVASFRGNGVQDIVADGRLLLGNGDGTFSAPVNLNLGAAGALVSLAIGDFNGDGKLDIVTSNAAPSSSSGSPSLGFLAGNGDGTFQPIQLTNVGEAANALAVGAFNADGKLDVVLASSTGSNTVTVLPANGKGGFQTAPSVPADVAPDAIAAGDFNGDGRTDLVTTGGAGNAVVLLNNGDGTFRQGPTLQVQGTPDSVVVGDFNGDGKADVAVGTEAGKIDVFLGTGNGAFQAPRVLDLGSNVSIQSMAAADFNHDGKTDLAVTVNLLDNQQTGLVEVFTSNGNGTFRKTAAVTVGVLADGLAATDLNGDGRLDLVTTSFLPDGSRDVKVLLGNGNGTFQKPLATTPGGSATSVAAGDFNGDGKPDLVLADGRNDTLLVLPGNGNGAFGKPIPFLFDTPVAGLGGPVVGDFFGDHKLGIAVTTGLGDVSVLRGNGDGTFQAALNLLANYHGTEPSALAAADFNGDGKLDLAATGLLSNDVSVLLNTTPAATVAAPVSTATTLSVPPSATAGQRLTLTATVTAAAGVPTGSVTFFDGGTVLGEVALDPNGQASLVLPLGVGGHELRASFSGVGPFAASTSATVNETVTRAATRTTLSVDPSVTGGGVAFLNVTVGPVAPGAGTPTGTVTVFDGTKALGTLTLSGGEGSLFVFGLARGKHTLTAVYNGDENFQGSTSDPLILEV